MRKAFCRALGFMMVVLKHRRSFFSFVQLGYTEKTDLWSFGVMAYALLFNEPCLLTTWVPVAPEAKQSAQLLCLAALREKGSSTLRTEF